MYKWKIWIHFYEYRRTELFYNDKYNNYHSTPSQCNILVADWWISDWLDTHTHTHTHRITVNVVDDLSELLNSMLHLKIVWDSKMSWKLEIEWHMPWEYAVNYNNV